MKKRRKKIDRVWAMERPEWAEKARKACEELGSSIPENLVRFKFVAIFVDDRNIEWEGYGPGAKVPGAYLGRSR